MEKAEGIRDFFINILTAKIPLWYFLVSIMIAFIVALMTIHCRKKKLPFLNHSEEDYGGFKFQWVWKLEETTGHYRMDDFWPICPQCGMQLRVEKYDPIDAYHCSNGHLYNLNKVYNLKKDLVHKLQRDYEEYANMIDYSHL